MSESDEIYTTYKGAGGPGAPPPQRPGTDPTKERIRVVIIFAILVPIAFIFFGPMFFLSGTLLQHIISALCGGVIIAIWDWAIEAYAHKKGLWFCYGGYDKVGKVDFKHVPFDMLVFFVFYGFILSFVSYFPALFRFWGFDIIPINYVILDTIAIAVLLVALSLFGSFADFNSKKQGVWMNGPTWTYWKCAFYAWLPLLASGVIIDHLIFYFLLT